MPSRISRLKRIRIAIIEDDGRLRQSLGELLGAMSGFAVVAAFGSAESALAEMEKLRPDVVLVDINLPGLDGIECVRQMRPLLPETQFIMVTVYEDDERLFNSLQAGADGYLIKRAAPAKLHEAITQVMAGGSPMTPQIARRLVQHFRNNHKPEDPDLGSLGQREREVLENLAAGRSYKEIADRLGVSKDTVRTYIRRLYEKLRIHSRNEAVLRYLGR
jgi:DNA-binding NarL/FixJ family response regulator